MDIKMPNINGFEASKIIKEWTSKRYTSGFAVCFWWDEKERVH